MSDNSLVVPNHNNNSSNTNINNNTNSSNNNQTTISNNWRSSTTTSSMSTSTNPGVGVLGADNSNTTASIQKRGAERLFSYMEADGSDTEDYSR